VTRSPTSPYWGWSSVFRKQVKERAGRDGKSYKQPTKAEIAAALRKEKLAEEQTAQAEKVTAEKEEPDIGVPNPSDWTDEEIEAENGQPIATEEEVIRNEILTLAKFAQRVENVEYDKVILTEEIQDEITKVLAIWTVVSVKAEDRAEELRAVYTGVSGKVGQVQKLYLELPDQEQTYFRRWLKSQLSAEQKTMDTAPVEEPAVDQPVVEEPVVEDKTDEEILKLLARGKWVTVPMWRDRLGISEETIERLVAAGKVQRHQKTPSTIGVVS
jgi:hypothetical protein